MDVCIRTLRYVTRRVNMSDHTGGRDLVSLLKQRLGPHVHVVAARPVGVLDNDPEPTTEVVVVIFLPANSDHLAARHRVNIGSKRS
jgi:hypothetical protein